MAFNFKLKERRRRRRQRNRKKMIVNDFLEIISFKSNYYIFTKWSNLKNLLTFTTVYRQYILYWNQAEIFCKHHNDLMLRKIFKFYDFCKSYLINVNFLFFAMATPVQLFKQAYFNHLQTLRPNNLNIPQRRTQNSGFLWKFRVIKLSALENENKTFRYISAAFNSLCIWSLN